jgi:hypothetical protein
MKVIHVTLFMVASGLAEGHVSNSTGSSLRRPVPILFVDFLYESEYLQSIKTQAEVDALLSRQVLRMDAPTSKLIHISKDVGNARILEDFVYHDPRNVLQGGDISVAVLGHLHNDTTLMPPADQAYWFRQAILQWTQAPCAQSKPSPFTFVPARDPTKSGVVEHHLLTGEMDWSLVQADIQVVGFKTAGEFPLFTEYPRTLGICVALCWGEESNGDLMTDMDGNGYCDAAVVSTKKHERLHNIIQRLNLNCISPYSGSVNSTSTRM